MHGFIFTEIRDFVTSALGPQAWGTLLKKAGLGERDYERFLEYPDGEAVALVVTASEVTGQPVPAILESFGAFLAPHLVKAFRPLFDPSWRTLDFLEHSEQTIHKVVRSRNRQAHPPALSWQRTAPDEILLTYSSARKMCPLARGIVLGAARVFGEEVTVEESTCMHRGDRACTMVVRTLGPSA